jgi:hypothetical protein
MLRSCLPCVVLTVGLAVPAQAQVKLEWNFKEGDTFYVENVNKMKQSLGAGGNLREQEKTTTAVSRYKVVKKTADGTVLEMQFAGRKTESKDGGAALVDPLIEKLKDVTFRITLDPTGQVTKFEGFDEVIKKIAGDNEATAKMLRAGGLEDSFKEGVTPGRAHYGNAWKTRDSNSRDSGNRPFFSP